MTPLNTTQVRDGIAWATNTQPESLEADKTAWLWFWEAVQGDFNEERSTSQIMTDAAISMIPGVDQICDLRDLIANCKKLKEDLTDSWAWISLAFTLIGLIPSLGSLLKGVLKIFFLFIRKHGEDAVAKAVDSAMTWVTPFLRRRDVQKYLARLHIDDVYSWLDIKLLELRTNIKVETLLSAFDRGIWALEKLVRQVESLPRVGERAERIFEEVKNIRSLAEAPFRKALTPLIRQIDAIRLQLRMRMLYEKHGIINALNVNFRGTLPELSAINLMRIANPRPKWLSSGPFGPFSSVQPSKKRAEVDQAVKQGWPELSDTNIESFHKLSRLEIKGPARLYRILSPNSRAMSDCWITEEIFQKLQSSSDPRAAWRKYLAVWPDWNANGQFVTYDVKHGETLKVWSGPASSQTKKGLNDMYLEGGWEQIVFKIDRASPANDTTRYYRIAGAKKNRLEYPITQDAYNKLTPLEKEEYALVREKINHPNITGPFETGWGYTDFDGNGFPHRVGLPNLSGQATN